MDQEILFELDNGDSRTNFEPFPFALGLGKITTSTPKRVGNMEKFFPSFALIISKCSVSFLLLLKVCVCLHTTFVFSSYLFLKF